MTRGTVVVLGKTGRNFAAGMSGGVAYVLDADGDFTPCCNMSMVELDPMDEQDFATVKDLVQPPLRVHRKHRCLAHLSGWKDTSRHFVKVMPVEYRKVLAAAHLDSEAVAASASV